MLTTIYLCSTKHFRLIPLIEHQNHDGHIVLSCFVISQLIKEILKEGDDCFFYKIEPKILQHNELGTINVYFTQLNVIYLFVVKTTDDL